MKKSLIRTCEDFGIPKPGLILQLEGMDSCENLEFNKKAKNAILKWLDKIENYIDAEYNEGIKETNAKKILNACAMYLKGSKTLKEQFSYNVDPKLRSGVLESMRIARLYLENPETFRLISLASCEKDGRNYFQSRGKVIGDIVISSGEDLSNWVEGNRLANRRMKDRGYEYS